MKPIEIQGSKISTTSGATGQSLASCDRKSTLRPVALNFTVWQRSSRPSIRAARLLVPSIILLASFAWATPPAVIFNVNDNRDTVDLDAGDGLCLTVDGTCTLRAAVMAANHYDEILQINLPAGVYTLRAPSGSDGDDTGDLNLVSALNSPYVIIFGAGAANTIIDGNMTDRVFSIQSQRSVSMSGVTLRNGKASSYGGAIYNSGTLILTDVTILNNSTVFGGGFFNDGMAYLTRVAFSHNAATYGGGIYNTGALTMDESSFDSNTAQVGGGLVNLAGEDLANSNLRHVTFNANKATDKGGGIYNGTQLTVADSSFSGNEAVTKGGGIFNATGSQLEIDRSTILGGRAQQGAGIHNSGGMTVLNATISANASTSSGGGINNDGAMNVNNSTIAFNEADAAGLGSTGAGIENSGTLNLRNSVVAGNYLYGAQDYSDCTGIIGIYGNNKFTGTDGCFPAVGSPGSASFLDSIYELGILKDNGGPTRTVALIPPSSLIDGATGCVDQNNVPLSTDQRGRPRAVGASCDIGAFEYDPGDIFANGFQ
jgi:predicted outer membrane repeat protein